MDAKITRRRHDRDGQHSFHDRGSLSVNELLVMTHAIISAVAIHQTDRLYAFYPLFPLRTLLGYASRDNSPLC